MWPLQRLGPYRVQVRANQREVRLVRRAARDTGPQMPSGGCADRKGLRCKHTVAKCANCGGPNSGQAKVCPRRKAARSEAKGWRSTPPRWRQRGQAPGVTEPQATAEGGQADGGAEEQIRHESRSGEEMQE